MPEVEIQDTETSVLMAATDKTLRPASLGKVGRSAARRQAAILQLWRRLQRETRVDSTSGRVVGPNTPCTVVNFNPIDVLVDIEGRRITIPAARKFDKGNVKMTHQGREISGAYGVIGAPIMYSTPTGHEADTESGTDVLVTEPRAFSPHAIGCALWHRYNSPNHKLTGGILLFDQDVRQLTSETLERNGNRIWIPERVQLDGSANKAPEWLYGVRESDLYEELDRIFATQRAYCDAEIQQAHTFWTEGEQARKFITNTHREWARYAVLMSWMDELPEWVTSRVSAAGPVKHLVKCRYCQTQQPTEDVLFCKECNAPFDAYKAFKWRGPNGERVVVPQQFLEGLEGEQLEDVLEELRARRARFAELSDSAVAASQAAQSRGAVRGPDGKFIKAGEATS